MKAWVGFLDISKNTGKIPLGWSVISWVCNTPICHCLILFSNPEKPKGEWEVFETTETRYEKRPLKERMSGCTVYFYPLEGDVQKAYDYCTEKLGVPYDYTGIAGLGLLLLAERVLNWLVWPLSFLVKGTTSRVAFVGNPLHMEKAYFCSEIAVGACRKAGMKLPEWWLGESVTPHQFHRWFMDEGIKEDKIW